MSFDEVKDQLKETYKTRKCPWCKKSCKDCDPKCNCFYCKFGDNYDLVVGDHQHIKDWMMSNLKFFKKLYEEGLAEETVLIKKWQKRQLFTIERTRTRILDWTTDNEVVGVPRRNHLPPEDYQIITPYHDFRKPKDLQLNYCQLCGRDLEYNYYIKHDEKKLCIRIGHECAEAFCLSEVFVQILKNHMRWIVEKEFKKLEIPPTKIAKLLLELEKVGFVISENEKVRKKHVKPTMDNKLEEKIKIKKDEDKTNILEEKESTVAIIIDKNIRKLIFEKIKKLMGPNQNAVNEDRIIQEMQMQGMSKNEIIEYLKDMLQRKDIYEFLPHQYKIPSILL